MPHKASPRDELMPTDPESQSLLEAWQSLLGLTTTVIVKRNLV